MHYPCHSRRALENRHVQQGWARLQWQVLKLRQALSNSGLRLCHPILSQETCKTQWSMSFGALQVNPGLGDVWWYCLGLLRNAIFSTICQSFVIKTKVRTQEILDLEEGWLLRWFAACIFFEYLTSTTTCHVISYHSNAGAFSATGLGHTLKRLLLGFLVAFYSWKFRKWSAMPESWRIECSWEPSKMDRIWWNGVRHQHTTRGRDGTPKHAKACGR